MVISKEKRLLFAGYLELEFLKKVISIHALLKATGKLSKTKQTNTSLGLLQRSEFNSLSSLNFFKFFISSLGCSFNCETYVHFHKLYTIYKIPDLLRLVVLPCTMPYPPSPPPPGFCAKSFLGILHVHTPPPGHFFYFFFGKLEMRTINKTKTINLKVMLCHL